MINWDAVGAVGELEGTLVVVVTLAYLARHVSQAQRSMRQQYHDNVNGLFNSSLTAAAASPDLARAIARVENGDELSPVEYAQVRSHVMTILNGYENAFLHAQEVTGVLDSPDIQRMVRSYLKSPAYKRIWREVEAGLNPGFVATIDTDTMSNHIE